MCYFHANGMMIAIDEHVLKKELAQPRLGMPDITNATVYTVKRCI